MNLTPDEIKLARKCVRGSLDLQKRMASPAVEKAYAYEPGTLRRVRQAKEEVPKLKKLFNKLKGK